MIQILSFCMQTFKLEQLSNVSVRRLQELSAQYEPDLFVVHDPEYKLSALVIPELVTKTVDKFSLSGDDSAVAVGLMDVLRQYQMTVQQNQPADRVVKLAGLRSAHVVIAVNDDSVPVGLFIPSVVSERLPHTGFAENPPHLTPIILNHISNRDLAAAIAEIDKEHKQFHSEKINYDASDPYVCAGDEEDGSHNINSCPCRYHPAAGCGKRLVAQNP